MPATPSAPTVQRTFFGLATLLLVITALYFGRSVLLPLALAALLSFILTPAVSWLERHRFRRTPAVLVMTVAVFALLGGLGYFLTLQVGQLAAELRQDKYQKNITAKVDSLPAAVADPLRGLLRSSGNVSSSVNEAKKEAEAAGAKEPKPAPAAAAAGPGLEWVKEYAPPAAEGLATALLVVVLAIFMLVKREDLRDRMIRLFGRGHLTATTRAIDEAGSRISRYLSMLSLVNLSCGLVLSAGFYFLDVPYPLLWGLLVGALRFIPYVGVWVGALFPLVLSAATAPDWYHPLGALGLVLALELVVGNLVEPVLYGRTMGVSEVALLVTAAFWAWLWGPVGLVLAVPMTVCLAVLGKYVPQLEFFAVLLRDEPVLDPSVRYYQRLLARDEDEAEDMVEEYLHDKPWESVFDAVLLPALVLAKHDNERGDLDDDDKQGIYQTTRDVLEDLTLRQQQISKIASKPVTAEPPQPERPPVIAFGCPAHDEGDELALRMMEQLLASVGCRLRVFSPRSLAAEILQEVGKEQPAFVCLMAVAPGGVAQARHLCKRLRLQYPDLRLLVVRWGKDEALERARASLTEAGADAVVTTLQEAKAQVLPLVQTTPHLTPRPADERMQPVG